MPKPTLRQQLTDLLADALTTGEPNNAADIVAAMMPVIIRDTHTLTLDETTHMVVNYGNGTYYRLAAISRTGDELVYRLRKVTP